MPEGDTVFKLAAYLGPALSGRRLVTGLVRSATTLDVTGRQIGRVFARGKHLFIELDDGRLLRSHLGMRGSWHGYAPQEPWQRPRHQAAIVLDTGERTFVCFNPLQVEVLRAGGVRERQFAITLGADLLSPEVDFGAIVTRARAIAAPTTLIVDVLLDQRVASGIGNVYKSEVLFIEGLAPQTPLGDLRDAQLVRLYQRAARLLAGNLSGGPRITRRANDDAGRLWVYRRAGQPCLRCDEVIRSARLGRGQRSTYWCPRCQHIPETT